VAASSEAMATERPQKVIFLSLQTHSILYTARASYKKGKPVILSPLKKAKKAKKMKKTKKAKNSLLIMRSQKKKIGK
jgi:hypothetical protein